jgi:hypothetical protein
MFEMQPPKTEITGTKDTASRRPSSFSVAFHQRHTLILLPIVFFCCLIIELIITRNLTIILFLTLIDVTVAFVVSWVAAKPLAVFAYLQTVRKELRQFGRIYTPLSALKNFYETPIDYHTNEESKEPKQDITNLIKRAKTHLLVLGLPGAGKTITLRAFQYAALTKYWPLIFGDEKIPTYISMRDYNVFLSKSNMDASAGGPIQGPHALPIAMAAPSLVAYLLGNNEQQGLYFIHPYLEKMAKQGKLLFLCDGLNEIDERRLAFVSSELVSIMQNTENRLVMTCRELDYRNQAVLSSLVEKHHAAEALILPLRLDDIHKFVEQYTKYSNDEGKPWRYESQDINQLIEHSNMSYSCTNPMMLVTMMKIINQVGIEHGLELDTRGRLLSRFVSQVVRREITQPQWNTVKEDDVILFLSLVA